MSKKFILIIVGVVLIGMLTAFLAFPRTATLVINGESQTISTHALTVAGVMRQAGIPVSTEDRLDPPLSAWVKPRMTIQLDQAQAVTIAILPAGDVLELSSPLHRPSDWLAEAGLLLGDRDRLTLNGLPVDPDQVLAFTPQLLLELHQAVQINLREEGASQSLFSSAATLGQALWAAGIALSPADAVSLPLDTPLTGPLDVEINRAARVTIQISGEEISVPSASASVVEVLREAGITLQGLDYSFPAEGDPLPPDRAIRVVRVREEVLLTQEPIPYKNALQPDENTELDKRSVVKSGEYGVQVSREKVIYEDGVEVSRSQEDQWVAKEPQDQIVGYGTKPVINTIDTPSGTLEYWRAVNVYATSYSPCRLGIPNYCNSTTASGLTVRQGIVAVTRAWYSWMVGQRVYIPGYGIAVIADVGGGIPGRYWVDLGYNDDDFVSWHQNVTMYFLTPVPANIPWILP